VDVRGDREVLMVYTSFNQSLDSAWIWAYGVPESLCGNTMRRRPSRKDSIPLTEARLAALNRGLVSGTGLADLRLKRPDRYPCGFLWVYHGRHGLPRTGIRA
jgi:hypothetical protein